MLSSERILALMAVCQLPMPTSASLLAAVGLLIERQGRVERYERRSGRG